MAVDVEAGVDRLFGVDLGEFVRERTELVRALRAEGRRAEAASVEELRKPALSVWTVNQLARRCRNEVDLLLDAGHRMVTAQRALAPGEGRQAFDEARERLRTALNNLVDEARAILAERASTATLERVATTLRAAATSDEARPDLARGRLTGDLEPAGFEALAGSLPVRRRPGSVGATTKRRASAGTPEARERERADRENAARREALEAARAELKVAREREASAARALRDAERAAHAANKEAERAEREADRLRHERKLASEAVQAARAKIERLR